VIADVDFKLPIEHVFVLYYTRTVDQTRVYYIARLYCLCGRHCYQKNVFLTSSIEYFCLRRIQFDVCNRNKKTFQAWKVSGHVTATVHSTQLTEVDLVYTTRKKHVQLL